MVVPSFVVIVFMNSIVLPVASDRLSLRRQPGRDTWNLHCRSMGRRRYMPNKDEVAGKADQIKGKVKQAVGRATDNPDLEDEGTVDEAGGEVREGFGTAKRKVGEAVKDLGNAIKR